MRFDVAVIGGGPGGYVAAEHAANEGLSVVLFEKAELGGTCLNRGCIPTKSLLHAAETLDSMRNADSLGLHAGDVSYDFAAIHAKREETVVSLRKGVENLMKKCKVTVVEGFAQIVSAGKISCNGEVYEAGDIIIATGSVPQIPAVEGNDIPGVITSNDVLEGDGVEAKRIVIWGAGVVAVECASIYLALGCEVTIIVRSKLLRIMDKEIGQRLNMFFKKRNLKVLEQTALQKIEGAPGNMKVTFTDKKDQEGSIDCDYVLIATGRKSYTEGLFAEGCDCIPEMDRGAVVGDELGRTSVEHLYIIGDAKAKNTQLAHLASAQGVNVARFIAGKDPIMDTNTVPNCIYTSPEIATVGLSADEAKEAGLDVATRKIPTGSNGKCLIEEADSGFVKVVYETESHKILGAQLVCPRATDMVAELAICVSHGLTMEDLMSVIHPHPTFCEMIWEASVL